MCRLGVSQSCYSSELACPGNPRTGIKTLELLRDGSGKSRSYYFSTSQYTVNLNIGPNSITPLSPGTHVYPFCFLINPNSLPANITSRFGSTTYRVESLAIFVTKNTSFETVFLTKGVAVRKVLPPSNTMRHECISSKESWNNGLLEYSLFVCTIRQRFGSE